MALEKRVVLDRIEIERDGMIFFRLLKQVMDGDTEIASEPHRSGVSPGVEAQDQAALVNENLQQMGWPPISDDDVRRLGDHSKLAHTTDVIAAFVAR